MHDTIVVMKDGTTFVGPLWNFRPEKGYLTLAAQDEDRKLYFRDMESCITKDERVARGITRDEDELARARDLGWDGT